MLPLASDEGCCFGLCFVEACLKGRCLLDVKEGLGVVTSKAGLGHRVRLLPGRCRLVMSCHPYQE